MARSISRNVVPKHKRHRVLVVNDARDLRWLLQRILEGESFQVETRASGKAALALLQRQRPDLVIQGITLPDMVGTRLLRRSLELHPTLPVIILSATVNGIIVEECRRLGCYAFIPKPFQLDELLRTVRTALAGES